MQTIERKKTVRLDPHETSGRWRKTLKIVLPIFILGVGLAGAVYIKKTAPQATKRPPVVMEPLVEVETVQKASEQVTVHAMGTVVPAQELVLKARVAGEVIEAHPDFMEGGLLQEGQEILRIDPQDYELAVTQKRSEVADARYRLKLELGHQEVAKREWQLLKGDKAASPDDMELALRKPHLDKAKAELTAAQANLEQAKLDLSRTKVSAPFNAMVRTKSVEQGSQVAAQERLAELVGTDSYWVQVSLPIDRLNWISIPRRSGEQGSLVHVQYGNGSTQRDGRVIKLLGDLESKGRLARILVEVQDPLDLKTPESDRLPLLIGEFVRVEILGHQVDNVVRIPRTALRDDTRVWVVGDDNQLIIREVDTLWRDQDTVLVSKGLEDGERLVVSNLAAPAAGMRLRIAQGEDRPQTAKMAAN